MSIKDKTEIVVLPEMFSTGFSMKPSKLAETMEGETVGWMRKMAIEKNYSYRKPHHRRSRKLFQPSHLDVT